LRTLNYLLTQPWVRWFSVQRLLRMCG